MTPETLDTRLAKDRPMVSVTLRMPQDAVGWLKALAQMEGMSGHQALLNACVSEGLRRDDAVHRPGPMSRLVGALHRRDVPEDVIGQAVPDVA